MTDDEIKEKEQGLTKYSQQNSLSMKKTEGAAQI